jgi:undecaprenyl-diphosphatase
VRSQATALEGRDGIAAAVKEKSAGIMHRSVGSIPKRLEGFIGGGTPVVLVMVLIVVVGVWGFIQLADEVMEGDTQVFDEWVVRTLRCPDTPARAIGPPWLAEVGRDLTALGGIAALGLVTVAVLGFLWLDRRYRMMLFVVLATAGGLGLSLVLKMAFDRPRPDVVPHLSYVHTSSFPSGHSMMSAVVYLTLAALLNTVLSRRRLKAYVLVVALGLSGLVGLSRVYMGVHYPSDVLAGWATGLVWAVVSWLVVHWLQVRGTVEAGPINHPENGSRRPMPGSVPARPSSRSTSHST